MNRWTRNLVGLLVLFVLAIPVAFVAMRWNVASIVVAGAIAISIGLLFNRWRSAAK